jgi:hypothetical protein
MATYVDMNQVIEKNRLQVVLQSLDSEKYKAIDVDKSLDFEKCKLSEQYKDFDVDIC